jgi:diguanylate cyclase (GGDEF)-like protein
VVVGWNTGFHYLMLPLLPVSMLANIRRPIKVGLGLALSLSYLALDAWGDRIAPLSPLAAPLEDALRYSNIVALFVIFALLSVCYLRVISRAQRTLLRLAYTDPLTGAINRRRLLELAQTAMARNKRHTASLSVLLCDMDHFKSINDLHGHDAGDLVLQAFHERVQAVIREVDSLCRWGGEEFLVLLPDTPLGGARQLAERIRQRVQQSPVWLGPPELGVAIEISVTIGVAELRAGEVFDSVVSRADQALYAGKHAGRNRVQTHDGSLAAAGMTAG